MRGMFHLYREFDETNDNHLFKTKKPKGKSGKDYLPLYKGGAIWQYEYNYNLDDSSRYVNSERLQSKNARHFCRRILQKLSVGD